MTKEDIAHYLVNVISPLLSKPEEAKCDVQTDDMGVLLTITVADGDFGKVVGRQGATIGAIRKLLTTVGMTHKIRTSVKINDPLVDQRA